MIRRHKHFRDAADATLAHAEQARRDLDNGRIADAVRVYRQAYFALLEMFSHTRSLPQHLESARLERLVIGSLWPRVREAAARGGPLPRSNAKCEPR